MRVINEESAITLPTNHVLAQPQHILPQNGPVRTRYHYLRRRPGHGLLG